MFISCSYILSDNLFSILNELKKKQNTGMIIDDAMIILNEKDHTRSENVVGNAKYKHRIRHCSYWYPSVGEHTSILK